VKNTPPSFVANFDSATGMVRALGAALRGEPFPALGESPLLKLPVRHANLLPWQLRRALYIFSGWQESRPPRQAPDMDVEQISRWVTGEYPDRQYPAVAIGSSNGAGVHLWTLLGTPWLPQTFLLPVRQSVHPDEPREAARLGVEPGRELLERNPDVQLHHMHDANQDRLMVRTMTYFRVKRRRLGAAYERWLVRHLPPGGTVYVVECEQTWGVTRIGDRHVFQHGAVGGATEREFHEGSERVADYLERYGSPYRRWDGPEPTERAPEAEWGFEPTLLEDVRRLARERRYRVVRVRFPEPQALSPLVADLYRTEYRRRGIPGNRLVLPSFVLTEPHWTLRTGSVPFWMEFNMEPSLEAVHAYLDSGEPYDDIGLMLFQHGVEAAGLPTAEQWQGVLDRAGRHGRWLGGTPEQFPKDFAQYATYDDALSSWPARHPLPGPLPGSRFEDFAAAAGDRYQVRLDHEQPAAAAA
jgi:hypothetical protein